MAKNACKMTKEEKAKSWFLRRYEKLMRRYMRRIACLFDRAEKRGMSMEDEEIASVLGVANDVVGDYGMNLSYDGEKNEVKAVIE